MSRLKPLNPIKKKVATRQFDCSKSTGRSYSRIPFFLSFISSLIVASCPTKSNQIVRYSHAFFFHFGTKLGQSDEYE